MILWSQQTGEVTVKAGLRDRAKGTLGGSQEEEEENPGLWECEELLIKWSVRQELVTSLCLSAPATQAVSCAMTRSNGSPVPSMLGPPCVVTGNPQDEIMRVDLTHVLQIWGQRLREAMWPAHRPH